MIHRLLHFESKHEQLLPKNLFYNRLFKSMLAGILIIVFFLGVGVAGYHFTCKIDWLDSLLNASMILSGMGPVNVVQTPAGKYFASFYALFSGVAFISSIGLFFAPIVHRGLHKFHLEDEG